MVAATQNINANKKYQLKITKETLVYKLCCSCVRLLVYRFISSMLTDNIRVMYVENDENILPNSVIGKKMIWCLALISKKIALQKTDG